MADILSFILKADDKASPVFQKVALDIKKLDQSVRAYGTGTQEARTATSKMLDGLIATRGAADTAAGGFAGANQAAKDLAKGGLRDLLSEVPIVGGALSKLAGTLGGFPLLLGAIAGAGLGVLKFLQGLSQDADKALESTSKLGASLAGKLQDAMLEIKKIRAESAGDQQGAIEAGAAKAIAALQREHEAAKAAADRELAQLDLFGRKRTELSTETAKKLKETEVDLALGTFKINEQKNADLKSLDEKRVQSAKEAREKEVKDAQEAAEKQKKLTEDLTTSSLATFKKLGAGFEDVVKSLEVAQFVQQTQAEIDKLNQAIGLGLDTTGRFTDGVAKLTMAQQESVRLGYVPTTEAAKAATEAVAGLGEATAQTTAQQQAAIDTGNALVDSYLAQARAAIAAEDAAKGAASAQAGGGGGSLGAGGGGRATGPGVTTAGRGGGSGGGTMSGLMTPELKASLDRVSQGLAATSASFARATESGSPGGGAYSGGGPGPYQPPQGVSGGSFTGAGAYDNFHFGPGGGGALDRNPPQYALGGVVRGPIGRPVMAIVHGGEEVIPANDRGRRSVVVNFTVNNTGTVVQQERDWDTVVEELRQRIGAV